MPGLGERLGEASCARVILGESIDVAVEGVDAGRGNDSRLAHGAAHQCLPRRACQANSRDVASRAPSGQPRPLLRQSVTVSKRRP